MIKNTDLRLGNYVTQDSNGERKPIVRIGSAAVKFEDGAASFFAHISGIPITPEVLDNSGLAKSNEFDMWYGFDHRLCVERIHGGWLWSIDDTGNNEGSIQRPVAYVHQLQNIVYWIFNKELNIKP